MARKTLAAQRRALGHDHPDTIRTMNQLANVLHDTKAKREEARVLYDEALATSRRVFAVGHRTTLKLMNDSALLFYNQGKLDLADKLLRETLAATQRSLGEQHPFCSTNMQILASIAADRGRWADAERWGREGYELSRRVLGEYHPRTLRIMGNFANAILGAGRVSESAALAEQALTLSLERLGEDEEATRRAMKTLGVIRFRQGHENEADRLLSRSLELTRRAHGEKSRLSVDAILSLITLRLQQGAMSEVQNLARSVFDALPPEDEWWSTWRQVDDVVFRTPSLALYLQNKDGDASKVAVDYLAWMRGFAEAQEPAPMSGNNYAWALCTCDPPSVRDGAEAVRMAQRGVEVTNARDPTVLDTLATAYALQGDLHKAVETQRKAVSMLPRRGRPANLHAHLQLALASFLRRSGEPVEADASKSELLARLCEGHPESKCQVLEHLGELVVLLFSNGQIYIGELLAGVLTDISSGVFENDKADLVPLPILYALRLESDKQDAASEAILRECLTIRQLMLGDGDWRTAQAKSLVGNALQHLDRFNEAGHMLKESLEQLQSAEATPAEELQKARARLAEYESALAAQP